MIPDSGDDWAGLIEEFESIRRDMLRLVEESGDLLRDVGHRITRAVAPTPGSSQTPL
jgi:hypothetical protein